jgi:hypothetical protein
MLKQDDYFDASDLGLEELNPRINVNISEVEDDKSKVLAVIEVSEDLRFHSELEDKYPSEPRVFNSDGTLTAEAYETLEGILKERYNAEYLQENTEVKGEPWISFELTLEVPADTSAEDLGSLIWEKTALVQFHNEADPGTYNSPYMFGTLITDARWERDNK